MTCLKEAALAPPPLRHFYCDWLPLEIKPPNEIINSSGSVYWAQGDQRCVYNQTEESPPAGHDKDSRFPSFISSLWWLSDSRILLELQQAWATGWLVLCGLNCSTGAMETASQIFTQSPVDTSRVTSSMVTAGENKHMHRELYPRRPSLLVLQLIIAFVKLAQTT